MKILFDLGNVVIDWNVQKIMAALELSDNKKMIIQSSLFENGTWDKLDKGLFTEKEVAENLVNNSVLEHEDMRLVFQQTKVSLENIQSTINLMHELSTAAVPMYALSNMSIETYSHIKDRQFFNFFEDFVISGYIKMAKPEAAIFEYTLNKFGLNPAETLFIDDSYPNIETAEALGIQCLHFKRSDSCYQKIRAAAKLPIK